MRQQDKALKKLRIARLKLMSDPSAFVLRDLSLRLPLIPTRAIPTAAVDGSRLFYNPDFISACNADETLFVLVHELLHVALLHPFRRGGRHKKAWNVAADFAVNHIAMDSGYTLVDGAIHPRMHQEFVRFEGKNVEWIYERLPKKEGAGGPGTEEGAPGSDVLTPDEGRGLAKESGENTDGSRELNQQDVERVVKAAMEKMQGNAAANFRRALGVAMRTKVNWRAEMLRFAQEKAADDYSWMRPNRRYLPYDVIIPGAYSENVGKVVAFVDTSGSIGNNLLNKFVNALQDLLDQVRPRMLHIACCDAAVHTAQDFLVGAKLHHSIHIKGGGGTSFIPAFKHVDEMDEKPACIIYLTDLYGSFPRETPDIPTLWLVPAEQHDIPAVPFGEVILAE